MSLGGIVKLCRIGRAFILPWVVEHALSTLTVTEGAPGFDLRFRPDGIM